MARRDATQRMHGLTSTASTMFFVPESDITELDRRHVERWLRNLREAEAGARRLRKRLETLRARSSPGICPVCGHTVIGRSDAVYCRPECRVRAHRERTRNVLRTSHGPADPVEGETAGQEA